MKQQVNGNLTGIRDSVIDALAQLYNYEVEDGDFLPRELMQFLAKFTGALNREIAVYITRDGEIVVALVHGEEATLKYLSRENGMIRLDPANGAYPAQVYFPQDVVVQGRLAGLLRRYN